MKTFQDASTRKWKQLPSEFRKIVWQIKKIEKDDSEDFEDEDADFDDITEFEVPPSISTTRENIQHFLLKKKSPSKWRPTFWSWIYFTSLEPKK